jgi:hypothetical protein
MKSTFGMLKENPALQYSEAKQFLAYKNDKIVGRIALMINHKEERTRDKKVRFGWIDFIDDEKVSQALIKKQLSTPKKKTSERLKDQWVSPILIKQEC